MGTDRAARKAADEIIEAHEDEGTGERPPQRRRIDDEGVRRDRIEDDEGAKEPRLRHQEMVGADAGAGSLLVDEVGEAVTKHGHTVVENGLAHASSCTVHPLLRTRPNTGTATSGAFPWRSATASP